MIRSFYTAASGMITENRNLATISNNIANMGTVGFKKDIAINNTFEERLISSVSANGVQQIGAMSLGKYNETVVTNHESGSFETTGRTLDFAIKGEGFFTVQGQNGQQLLTRDGQFVLDNDGYLTLTKGGRVLNDLGQPIYLGTSKFQVNGQGQIYVDGQYYDTLGITGIYDKNQLVKVQEGVFANQNPNNQYGMMEPEVLWQTLEKSNVTITEEMSKSLVSSRNFQSCSQILKMIDSITQKTVTEIARF